MSAHWSNSFRNTLLGDAQKGSKFPAGKFASEIATLELPHTLLPGAAAYIACTP